MAKIDWDRPPRLHRLWYEAANAFDNKPCEAPSPKERKRKKRSKVRKSVPAKSLINWVTATPAEAQEWSKYAPRKRCSKREDVSGESEP